MEKPMGFAEAAEALGVGESWLRREVAARRVPFVKLGRSVRFWPEHIEAIKEQHLVQPTPRYRAAPWTH